MYADFGGERASPEKPRGRVRWLWDPEDASDRTERPRRPDQSNENYPQKYQLLRVLLNPATL